MNVEITDNNKKRQSFLDYHATGGAGLNYAGFECLNGIFQFALDGVTDVTGYGGSGKSEFALELLFYQSETFGLRHLIYAPDIGNYNEIRRKLMVKHMRRSFRGYEHSLKQSDLISASAWIDHHFLIAQKKDVKKPLQPNELWDFATSYEDDGGIINTCFIDSWKNMYHPIKDFGREDQYLDYILSYRNEVAEQAQKHFITIAHPAKTEIEKTDNGNKRRVPDANDIKGGGSWLANGKVICTVDYPNKDSNDADIYFSKIKPDTLGKARSVIGMLEFDWQKSRYRETINGRICYAGEAKKEGLGTQSEEFLKKFDKPNTIAPSKNLEMFNDDKVPF